MQCVFRCIQQFLHEAHAVIALNIWCRVCEPQRLAEQPTKSAHDPFLEIRFHADDIELDSGNGAGGVLKRYGIGNLILYGQLEQGIDVHFYPVDTSPHELC